MIKELINKLKCTFRLEKNENINKRDEGRERYIKGDKIIIILKIVILCQNSY